MKKNSSKSKLEHTYMPKHIENVKEMLEKCDFTIEALISTEADYSKIDEYIEDGTILYHGPRKLLVVDPELFEKNPRKCEQQRTVEERYKEARSRLEDITDGLGLNKQVLEDFDNGIIDISYIDDETMTGHILHLEDDSEFMEYKKKFEETWGATVYHAIKWDAAESPVFLAVSEDMNVYERYVGIIVSYMDREFSVNAYYWFDGKAYCNIERIDVHDGALYLCIAFPGLQESENDLSKSVVNKLKVRPQATYETLKPFLE